MTMPKTAQRRIHLLVLALYAILAVALTWPLVRFLGSHVPGSYTWAFDEYTFLWNMWWFRHALFDLGQNPLYATHIFYPLGISLVLYTYNLFNAIISLPLQPYLPLPAISNLIFFFSTVLSGYGTFLLVTHLLQETQYAKQPLVARNTQHGMDAPHSAFRIAYYAAFLAGLIYAYGSYRMVYAAIGHYNLWSTTWIPFYALYFLKTIRAPRLRNAVLAGVFFTFVLLNEMLLGVFVAMLSLILLGFALGKRNRAGIAGGPAGLFKRLVIVAGVAMALYAPVLLPLAGEFLGGYELAGWGDAEKLSVDLLGFVTPTALHPLGGDWADTLRQTREGTSRFRDINTVFLGWAGLALAIVGAVRYRRRLAAWITGAVAFAIFSLGPLLQINGRSLFDLDGLVVNVPLPFILLHYTPVIKANRVPNRFGVVLMLCVAVLAGFGAFWLLKKVAGAKWPVARVVAAVGTLLLAGLVVFEQWSVPLPLTDARIPPAYEIVTADVTDLGAGGAVLQLPMGWRNGFGVQGAESTQTQYFQSYHQQRLLSGNTSRNPPFKFDYFRQVPILDSLITLQTYGEVDAERRAADRATAGEFVGFYDIGHVVVAPGVPGRPPYVDTRDAAVAYIEEVLPLEKIYDREGWLVYRVEQPTAPAALSVDFGSPGPLTKMALGEGWAAAAEIQGTSANWAVEQQARVFLPAAAEEEHRLTVVGLPFDFPDADAQGLQPEINGHRLERVAMSAGWQPYTWQVSAEYVNPGLNKVRFAFDRLDAPADVLPGNGIIGATGVRAPIAIEVNSGGLEGFAFITVGTGDEAEDGSMHGPGYNLAVIHPKSGQVLDLRTFDTTPSGGDAAAAALADYVDSVPVGHIVAVALQGDGTSRLNDESVAAFQAIGGSADPRKMVGSHAIIGVKGAAPGAALEGVGPGNGWLRIAPDWRTLAIAVDEIIWEPASEQE